MNVLNMLREPNYKETTSIQQIFKYSCKLMSKHLYLAAAGLLINILSVVEGDAHAKSQVSSMIVTCAIALKNVEFMKLVKNVDDTFLVEKVSMLLNTSLHEKHKNRLLSNSSDETVALGGGSKILICAGGDDLLTQAWANIRSLRDTGCRMPVTIVHADELSEKQTKIMAKLNVSFMNLKKYPYASRLPSIPKEYESLKGFQIKIAALVATDADQVILSDADIVWVSNPENYLSGANVHTFQDIWHMSNKQHNKSAQTAWLYKLHGMCTNVQETESGVVVMNRKECQSMVITLSRILENIDYYFKLAFGDKDLYDLAAHVNNISISKSPLPHILGYVEGNMFVCQSMKQPTMDGTTSHVHMTIFPFTKDQSNIIPPSYECKDLSHIDFVGVNNEKLGSTKDLVDPLPADNIIPYLISRAYHYSREYVAMDH